MKRQKMHQHPTPELHIRDQDDSEIQIVLAEYERQQQKFQTSLETVNQTFNIYVAVLAILLPVSIGAFSFWPQNHILLSLALAGFSMIAAAASLFTLVRSFQSRMDQTDAEKALCRLRNYFIAYYPNLSIYISDPIHDDWRTPYTHRWQSTTFYGWIALIIAIGLFVGISMFCLLLTLQVGWANWLKLITCISVGLAAFTLSYILVDVKLKSKKRRDSPRFPKESNYL